MKLQQFGPFFLDRAVAAAELGKKVADDEATRARDVEQGESVKRLEDHARKYLDIWLGPSDWITRGTEALVEFGHGERFFEFRGRESGWAAGGGHIPEAIELRVLCIQDSCTHPCETYFVTSVAEFGAAIQREVPSRCFEHDQKAHPAELAQEEEGPDTAERLAIALLEFLGEYGRAEE